MNIDSDKRLELVGAHEEGFKEYKLNVPPTPKWLLRINRNFVIEVHDRPCWLHRVTQRLFFGFRYERNRYR